MRRTIMTKPRLGILEEVFYRGEVHYNGRMRKAIEKLSDLGFVFFDFQVPGRNLIYRVTFTELGCRYFARQVLHAMQVQIVMRSWREENRKKTGHPYGRTSEEFDALSEKQRKILFGGL